MITGALVVAGAALVVVMVRGGRARPIAEASVARETPRSPTPPPPPAAALVAVSVDAGPSESQPPTPVPAVTEAPEPATAPPRDEPPAERRKGAGKLTVTMSPWADVWVDGRYRGSTPLTLDVSSGPHTVKLVKPDGSTEKVRVVVKAGRESKVSRK